MTDKKKVDTKSADIEIKLQILSAWLGKDSPSESKFATDPEMRLTKLYDDLVIHGRRGPWQGANPLRADQVRAWFKGQMPSRNSRQALATAIQQLATERYPDHPEAEKFEAGWLTNKFSNDAFRRLLGYQGGDEATLTFQDMAGADRLQTSFTADGLPATTSDQDNESAQSLTGRFFLYRHNETTGDLFRDIITIAPKKDQPSKLQCSLLGEGMSLIGQLIQTRNTLNFILQPKERRVGGFLVMLSLFRAPRNVRKVFTGLMMMPDEYTAQPTASQVILIKSNKTISQKDVSLLASADSLSDTQLHTVETIFSNQTNTQKSSLSANPKTLLPKHDLLDLLATPITNQK